MKSISVVGCGSVGKALCRLWAAGGALQVKQVLNRSYRSSSKAVRFIGQGEPAHSPEDLRPADLFMIGTPDDAIEEACRKLSAALPTLQGSIVFHCSGSLSSEILASARDKGASVGSAHPTKSFAHPAASAETFAGTYCAVEGDPEAKAELRAVFEAIGASVFEIDPAFKAEYHSASVFVSNYLVALTEVGLRCYERAGIPRETAIKIMQPIVRGTFANILKFGTTQALTGPIARGDAGVVEKHLQALNEWDRETARLYADLGKIALELAREQGSADESSLREIERLLEIL